jgi:cytoskeletal protein CcmA (bactofilin family)
MFRRREETTPPTPQTATAERVTTVLGEGISIKGKLGGSGGVRIEGGYEGNINLRGMLVIGETGRVTCEQINASAVVVAGAVKGDITADRVEIRATGRVWGNVTTAAFSTEEGAFLRGQIRMEEELEVDVEDASTEDDEREKED